MALAGQKFIIWYALQEKQANNLVNADPLLGLEFFAKADIL